MTYSIKGHFLYKDGIQVPYKRSPNVGGSLAAKAIIVHDTAGRLGAKGAISWLRNPAAKASAHLVIDRNGNVTQLVPFNRIAWHAGKSRLKIKGKNYSGLNRHSIGIENDNPGALKSISKGTYKSWFGETYFDVHYPIEKVKSKFHGRHQYWMDYTPEQIEANKEIIAILCHTYNTTEIHPHWKISPGRKVDTNPLYPLQKIREHVSGRAEKDLPVISSKLKTADLHHVSEWNGLPVRKWPSKLSKIETYLPTSTPVYVTKKGNITGKHWWKVSHNGYVGWVDSTYLK